MKLIDLIAYAGMFAGIVCSMILLRGVLGLPKWISIVVSVPLGAVGAVAIGAVGLKLFEMFEKRRKS